MFYLEPKRQAANARNEENFNYLFPIWILSGANGVAYFIFYFMRFRKSRSIENPLDTLNLYRIDGLLDKVKRVVFMMCLGVNTVLVPLGSVILVVIKSTDTEAF
jgi:hypothetical protein